MQRYKKHELEKSSKEKELFLQEHRGEDAMILYECYKDFNDLVNKYTDALHIKLFINHVYDSHADAKDGMPYDSDKTLKSCKEKILTLLCKTKYDDLAKN